MRFLSTLSFLCVYLYWTVCAVSFENLFLIEQESIGERERAREKEPFFNENMQTIFN